MKFISTKDLYFLSVIALIKLVSLFPAPRLKESVASGIASGAYHLSRNKRRLAEKNVSDVFGHKLSENRRREVVKGNFYEFWKDVFSLSFSEREKSELKRAKLHGLEHLQNALREGKGVILWESGSFGRRNLTKQILRENGFSICQVHGENHMGGFWYDRNSETWVRDHMIEPFFERREKEFVLDILYLPKSDSLAFTRRLLERLRRNEIICSRSDFSAGQKLTPQLLLGHKKFFPTGMISLAKISGASLLPIFCIQQRDGETSLNIERPIHIETGADRESGIENTIHKYTTLLESYIRRYPEKYHDWHFIDQSYEERLYLRFSQGKSNQVERL